MKTKLILITALLLSSSLWSVQYQMPNNTVDCDPQMVNGVEVQHCAVDEVQQ